MFGDPEEAVVDAGTAGGAEGAAGDEAGAAGSEGEPKRSIPATEYEALQRKSRELAELKSRTERSARESTTDTRSPEVVDQRRALEQEEDLLARLKLSAEARNPDGSYADPHAAATYVVHKRNVAAMQQTIYNAEMDRIPEDRRDAVRETMRQRGFTSPYAANRWMRADDADALEKKNQELTEQLEKRAAPRPKVENTKMPSETSRGGGATDKAKDIPYKEWIAGRSDPEKYKELKARKAAGAKIVGE